MIAKRLAHILATAGMTLSLLAGSIAAPAITFAGTPNWSRHSSIVGLPPKISVDEAAGYRATIVNDGPSKISSLSVSAAFSQPFDQNAAAGSGDPPIHVKLTKNGVEITSACTTSGALSCPVGELTAGSSAVLVVAYDTDSLASTSAGVVVRWTTVGLGSGSGDKSHGDVLKQALETAFGDANFDGGFTTQLATDFETDQALNSTNQFGTALNASGQFVPVTIQDDTDVTGAPCPVAPCYGKSGHQAVVFDINEGAHLPSLTPITVTVHKSAVPNGTNVFKVTVVHYFSSPPPAPALPYEEISNDCPENPTSTCRSVTWDGPTGIWTITIYLQEQSVIKFH